MPDKAESAQRPAKLFVVAMILVVVLPLASLLGWFYWVLSEGRPWMMGFGAFMAIFVVISWPLEFLLKRNRYLLACTGGGRFHETAVRAVSFYLPLVMVVALNDVDHARSTRSNLTEYVLTIALATGFLIAVEMLQAVAKQKWAALRQRRTSKE